MRYAWISLEQMRDSYLFQCDRDTEMWGIPHKPSLTGFIRYVRHNLASITSYSCTTREHPTWTHMQGKKKLYKLPYKGIDYSSHSGYCSGGS